MLGIRCNDSVFTDLLKNHHNPILMSSKRNLVNNVTPPHTPLLFFLSISHQPKVVENFFTLLHWPTDQLLGTTILQHFPTLKLCDSLTYPFFHCAFLSFLNFLTYFLVDRVGAKGRLAPRWALWQEDHSELKAIEA